MLNTREIAGAFWLAVFLLWALSHPRIRQSLRQLVRDFLAARVLSVFGMLALYTAFLVLILYRLELWVPPLLKDTILWFAGSAVVAVVTALTDSDWYAGLHKVLVNSVKLIVVLEFLVNLYTFPLWFELVAMPVMTAFVMLQTFAQHKPENAKLVGPLGCIIGAYGIAVLLASAYLAVQDLPNFLSLSTLRRFTLPVLLTFGALPLYYLLLLWAKYQHVFLIFRWRIQDRRLIALAKRHTLLRFHVRLRALDNWSKALPSADLRSSEAVREAVWSR